MVLGTVMRLHLSHPHDRSRSPKLANQLSGKWRKAFGIGGYGREAKVPISNIPLCLCCVPEDDFANHFCTEKGYQHIRTYEIVVR